MSLTSTTIGKKINLIIIIKCILAKLTQILKENKNF